LSYCIIRDTYRVSLEVFHHIVIHHIIGIVNLLLGELLEREIGRLLRLGKAFLLSLVALEMGLNFSPAFGGLISCGFPGVKKMILLASLDASSLYVDQINNLGELGDPLVPYTSTVIFLDLGSAFGGGVSTSVGLLGA
jgi:hypothetical protein